MKTILGIIVLVIIAVGGYMLWSPSAGPEAMEEEQEEMMDEMEEMTGSIVEDGTYVVVADESIVNWAGQKPLVDGYVNSGTLAVSEGSIEVLEETASGSFTIDMDTLDVGLTAKKPGSEGALESHLKGEGWFDVETFPTATFEITDVLKRADSDTAFMYDVTGDLTMKGETGTLSFPAKIYLDEEGMLRAEADFEFDRTEWGITAGSSSFFDNLADNAISDMVALSFSLVAELQ